MSELISQNPNSQPLIRVTPTQAESDEHLIHLWISRSYSEHTRRNYQAAALALQKFTDKLLEHITVGDLQAYLTHLSLKKDPKTGKNLAPATVALAARACKSLLTFGHEIGYLPFNAGKAIKSPPVKDTLASRILEEDQVEDMITSEPDLRNQTLLQVLYYGGLRVSELVTLTWADLHFRETGGQLTVFGKGGKTREVLLPSHVMNNLTALRDRQPETDPAVFRSKKGGQLDTTMVRRIVKKAALRVGIDKNVSPHWLRHAHASHALDRDAPIHLVQATLGHASVATTGIYLHARPNASSGSYLSEFDDSDESTTEMP